MSIAIESKFVPTGAQPVAAVRTRLRLTPRGRAVLMVLAALPLIALALALGLASGGAIADSDVSGAPVVFSTVIIEPGETLWQIALDYAPEEDPRDVIADIVRLNGLASTDVLPGQELALPLEF
ncbi:LysM peptidoglycan-binding domain-containing protein [Agromyces seonyuensis]|uniref:LysM peptidoglycan-binding domain-containing protein n=1 Tax=Agromyces seonyuensis TaxID=2662446 RepID=A0A6I4P750_9MICO|nr:LysM peptidoglycan-binding domain-containing protein [Agromyces seonyuensis]MWB99574.1 LysM peptidoglycan-binding domain-containing protein [Agromyces seonyuensis]